MRGPEGHNGYLGYSFVCAAPIFAIISKDMKQLFQHAATTHDVTVRVAVSYLPQQSDPQIGKWFWMYHIRIENGSHQTLQLISRHWRITDGRGYVSHVDGDGVVGEQPLLKPGQSHDYVSGCPLTTPTGSMEGFYSFTNEDGDPVEVRIPYFPLAVSEVLH